MRKVVEAALCIGILLLACNSALLVFPADGASCSATCGGGTTCECSGSWCTHIDGQGCATYDGQGNETTSCTCGKNRQ